MAWMLSNSEIHSTFAALGTLQGDIYHIGENCYANLCEIMVKLSQEDRTLRTFRRAIGFGQNIKKDLVPLLLHVKQDVQVIDATIRILVNLTIPVECLLSVEDMSQTDVGRHTLFELRQLLNTAKEIFSDSRITKAIIDYMRHILEGQERINSDGRESVNNCLLLLRNVLHIPEHKESLATLHLSSVQNKILWNLFTQSIDKLILHLIAYPNLTDKNKVKTYWGVTIVQLIALMYKDQHVSTLHKLLNLWFEASLSDSSEDNESNTSPPDLGSEDSSPILTSDPTSDSSDNGGSGKCKENNRINTYINNKNNHHSDNKQPTRPSVSTVQTILRSKGIKVTKKNTSQRMNSMETESKSSVSASSHKADNTSVAELSDCGYGTQLEKGSNSTSSNDDDIPQAKPVHQKPHNNSKIRHSVKPRISAIDKKEIRRKKLVKRSKTQNINMKGLIQHLPTDEDISNILKEFTVDFLLKGYGNLVRELHLQLLTDLSGQIDISHFFWLVTYFLKFAIQLELDLEHINSVLSFDIVSYLVYQGVYLSEELDLKVEGQDVKSCLRQLHLVSKNIADVPRLTQYKIAISYCVVALFRKFSFKEAVTAIREFLQAIDVYKKITHLSQEDRCHFQKLQMQLASNDNLKCLFLLLIRKYNPQIQSQQYLQDLIVTNHALLLFLDSVSKSSDYKGSFNTTDHLKKKQERIMLEEHRLEKMDRFASMEMMHRYGLLLENFRNNGEFVNDCVFTMMHHVGGDLDSVSTLFQPIILKTFSQIWETDYEICDDWSDLIEFVIHKFINTPQNSYLNSTKCVARALNTQTSNVDTIASDETKDLSVNPLINISRLITDSNIIMNRKLNVNSLSQYNKIVEINGFSNCAESHFIGDNISQLKESIIKQYGGHSLSWLQKNLIDACYVKLKIEEQKFNDIKNIIMESVPHYYTVMNQSIPIVTYTSEESEIMSQHEFVLLLKKLGFQMPADTGKLHVRIPRQWTADLTFSIALRLGSVDTASLPFDVSALNPNVDMKETRFFTKAETITNTKKPGSQCQNPADNIVYLLIQAVWIYYANCKLKPNPSTNWLQAVMNINAINTVKTSSERENITLGNPENIKMQTADKPSTVRITKTENSSDGTVNCIESNKNGDNHLLGGADRLLENNDLSETTSIASDLTRMYVSDEDEK